MAAASQILPSARSYVVGTCVTSQQELATLLNDDGPAFPKEAVHEIAASSKHGGKRAVVFFSAFVISIPILVCSIVPVCVPSKSSTTELLVGITGIVLASILLLGSIFAASGLFQVEPNVAVILSWFGEYSGTERAQGLRFVNPFYGKCRISLRLRTTETKQLKVNDKTGTPVEIGAIVVWHVGETARAKYHVDDFQSFVFKQAEAALRALALLHPYDVTPPDVRDGAQDIATREDISLRGNAAAVAAELRDELQRRVGVAGIEVAEARISHLAYAPEIAHAMLQRQQASAVIAARRSIVEGAVGILQNTVEDLEARFGMKAQKSEPLDLNRLVTNLLTVLVSHDNVQPVISTTS